MGVLTVLGRLLWCHTRPSSYRWWRRHLPPPCRKLVRCCRREAAERSSQPKTERQAVGPFWCTAGWVWHVQRTCSGACSTGSPRVHCMRTARALYVPSQWTACVRYSTATTHHNCIARCTAATAVSTSAERSPAHSEDIDMSPARAAGFAAK